MNFRITYILLSLFFLISFAFNSYADGFNDQIIHVQSGYELGQALGSNRTIIIDVDEIVVHKSVQIERIKNLKIRPADGMGKARIITTSGKEPTIMIKRAISIYIQNIEIGHKVARKPDGRVLSIRGAADIKIESCTLEGQAKEGLEVITVRGLKVVDTKFSNCMFQVLSMKNVIGGYFMRCEFSNNRNSGRFLLKDCMTVTFKDCLFQNNTSSTLPLFYHLDANNPNNEGEKCSYIDFVNCVIRNNRTKGFSNLKSRQFSFINLKQEGNSFPNPDPFPPRQIDK